MHQQLIGVYQPCQKALARSKCLSRHSFLATLNVTTFATGIAVSSNAFIRLALPALRTEVSSVLAWQEPVR